MSKEIRVYSASEQFLEWGHVTYITDNAKKVLPSEEEYNRLLAYDYIMELRNDLLEELYKR